MMIEAKTDLQVRQKRELLIGSLGENERLGGAEITVTTVVLPVPRGHARLPLTDGT